MNLVVLLYLILQVTGKAKILVYTIVQNYHLYFTDVIKSRKTVKKTPSQACFQENSNLQNHKWRNAKIYYKFVIVFLSSSSPIISEQIIY